MSGYCTSTFEIESTSEHRTPCQQRLFGISEQVIRPRHRVPQRLVALQPAPRTDQQPEPVIKAITVYLAVFTMFLNLLVDVLYKWVDPRVEFK